MDDLAHALLQLIESGHTWQMGRAHMYVEGVACVTVSISGPSGSRQATAATLQDAVGSLVVEIVRAGLSR